MPGQSARDPQAAIRSAMRQIPCGLFLLTAASEGIRRGVLVKWVQPCSTEPPMVMVALAKGQPIEPLIQNSRGFALCQISAEDRFLNRKFASDKNGATGRCDDSFVENMTLSAPSGAPIVERAMSYLDCELVRHVELDSGHRIYVGQVHSGAVLNPGTPAVCFGGGANGR